MASRNQHVVPHGEGWAIQSEGSARITSVFGTKREAIDKAQEIASQSGVELVVHGRQGQAFYSVNLPGHFSVKEIRNAVRTVADKSKRTSSRLGRTRLG
jgi:hypothetical protein